MTAGSERTVIVEATFLGEPRGAVAVVDSDDGEGLERIEVTLNPDDTVDFAVGENGGFAIYAPDRGPAGG